jgi:hypothetical protein
MEKMGIESIKDVLAFTFSTVNLVEALGDGVGLGDIGALVSVAKRAPKGLSALKSGMLIPELKDLDESEKLALKEFCVSEFDLKDDKLEGLIETGLVVAIDLTDLLKAWS